MKSDYSEQKNYFQNCSNIYNNISCTIDNNPYKNNENKMNNTENINLISENKETLKNIPPASENEKTKFTSKKRKNYEKKHPDKSLGRLSNKEKINGKKGTHTKDYVDNGKKVIIKDCFYNVVFFINQLLEDKNDIFNKIKLKHLLGKGNNNDLKQLLKKTLKDIFFNDKDYNFGNNDDNKENKNTIILINFLLNKYFAEYLYIYINDQDYIEIGNDDNCIYLPEFNTYKTLKHFTPEKQINLKNNILKMLEDISGIKLEKELIPKKKILSRIE